MQAYNLCLEIVDYPMLLVLSTVPGPNVALHVSPSTLYTSGDATISCTTSTTFDSPGVDATIKILRVENGVESEVVSTARITAGPVVEIVLDFVFQRSYSYSPASRMADSGSYVCEVTFTPEDAGLRPFITDGTSRSTLTAIDVVGECTVSPIVWIPRFKAVPRSS